MYIDYFNKKAFKLKMASYNDGKILHLDVTDADAPIKCRGCGSIKLKSLGGKTGTPGIYYDANVSPNGTWKFLYVTYHHNRGYQCQECNKKMRIKSKIPCKKGISADLRKQIVEMLVLDPSDKKRTWAKLIEEYTITDFKGTQVKGVENTTIQLLTKSRISRILKDYVEECERLIRGYALQENVIFHPFIYEKQTRGVVISCDKLDCTAEEQRKCTIDGFCDRHSAETLYKLLDANAVHFLGTDNHRAGSIYTRMDEIKKEFRKRIGRDKLYELSELNPRCILNNEEFEIEMPKRIKGKRR